MALRQTSMTQWLQDDKGENLSYAYPYFYLEWDAEKEFFPSQQARWYQNIPSEKRVAWKRLIRVGYRDVILCCSHPPPDTPTVGMFSGTIYDSFLKSHLQKAVRRKLTKAAVYTADLLLEMSPIQLLRRLPIIIVEDAFLHHSFSTLIWLMCAVSSSAKVGSNLFYLWENQKRWILGIAYHIASCEFKEIVSKKFHTKGNIKFSQLLGKIHALENDDIIDLIYSLEARRVYGGLKGDDEMLKAFVHYYLSRFSNSYKGRDKKGIWKRVFYQPIRPIHCKRVYFKEDEWIYTAYDFHCSPNILTQLEEIYPDYTKEDFQLCIWLCSSSRNMHCKIEMKDDEYVYVYDDKLPQYLTDLWKMIRKTVRGKGWGYVRRMLEELNSIYPDWIMFTPLKERETHKDSEIVDPDEKNQGDEEESEDLVSKVHLVI